MNSLEGCDFSLTRPSLRLILRRVRHRPFVLEHLSKITAVDPAAAGGTPKEVLGFVVGQAAEALPDVLAAGDGYHLPNPFFASRFT